MPPSGGEALKARLLDAADLDRTLDRLARQVAERLDDPTGPPALVGLQTRGVYLARRLRDKIETVERVRLPLGILDVAMYRDDVRRRPHLPVHPTDLPFPVDGRRIVLVDDVVYTGRTARAALDALMDFGRPAAVDFVALVDRGLRELPVCPTFVGRVVPTTPGEEVRVRLREVDGEDGVWLVETAAAPARPSPPA